MKFNFKKIASVLAGTVMLSSTVALAAASTLPAPFVQNGEGDVLVVYGSNPLASSTDMAAATEIQAYLTSKITKTTTETETETPTDTTVDGGDFVELNKATSKLNLGENLNSIYTSLDDDELSAVLADGTYEDTDGDEFDYEQKITLGAVALSHFADDDVDEDEKPVIGFNIGSDTQLLNYTLDFTDTPANASMDDTYLDMLGRTYYVSNVADSSSGLVIELLDTANSATVTSGTPVTVTVGDQTYEVSLVSADEDADPDKATLSVNGKKLDATNLGSSRKIAEDTYISILDLSEGQYQGDDEWVEFSIGTGKITLTDGADLEMNDETIDDVSVDLSTTSGELSQIKLIWTPEDESFLVPGMDLLLPGFEVIKLSMANFVTSEAEELSIQNNGDDYIELKNVNVKDGTVGSFPLIYTNLTNFGGLGKDATHKLLTSAGATLTLNETQNPKFVTTYTNGDDFETYLFELTSINEVDSGVKNETKLKNLADGSTITFSDSGSGDDKDVGELTLTVSSANGDAGTATLTVTSSGTVALNKIVTAEGLMMRLPVSVASSQAVDTDGEIFTGNATASGGTSWVMNFTEADEDSNVGLGSSFTATLGHAGTEDGLEVDLISPVEIAVESGSDDYEAYIGGDGSHATKLVYKTGGDNDVLDVEYHADEAYAKVFVSEASVTISGGSSGGGSSGSLLVMDSEVSSTTSKNLVVVGGSCVNTVAAQLLGVSYPTCGPEWQSATNVGAGSYLIKTFSRTGGKVATLVAGYNAGDTTNAAKAFTTLSSLDISAGKGYTGTTATTVTPVVA